MEGLLQELIEEAKYELFHYPVWTKKQTIIYGIKRFLRPANYPKRDGYFWTHAMLATALMEANEIEVVKNYYDSWIKKGMPVVYLDHVMHGYPLLALYEETGQESIKVAADKLYRFVCDYQDNMNDTLPYRVHHPSHIYVDGIGMTAPFLCRYGAMTDDEKAMEMGMRQIEDFLEKGMDYSSGLPYHGYNLKTGIKQGIIGWGRAVGWLLLAMVDGLEYMPEGNRKDKIEIALCKLITTIGEYIREDGSISWQLPAIEGPTDTSAMAMIVYGLEKTKQLGVVEKKATKPFETAKTVDHSDNLSSVIDKIGDALKQYCRDGKVYEASGECEGFSRYPQVYGAYPWSLGPAIRFLNSKK